jgi:hypothetical protein
MYNSYNILKLDYTLIFSYKEVEKSLTKYYDFIFELIIIYFFFINRQKKLLISYFINKFVIDLLIKIRYQYPNYNVNNFSSMRLLKLKDYKLNYWKLMLGHKYNNFNGYNRVNISDVSSKYPVYNLYYWDE